MSELAVDLSPYSHPRARPMEHPSTPPPWYSSNDEPVQLPVQRRWPVIAAIALTTAVLGFVAVRMVTLDDVPFQLTAQAPLDPELPEVDRVEREYPVRFEMSPGSAALAVKEVAALEEEAEVEEGPESNAAAAAAPPEVEKTSTRGEALKSRVAEPSEQRSRPKAADTPLTPAEIARRKAAYEQYLQKEGLRRIPDVTVRPLPDGGVRVVE